MSELKDTKAGYSINPLPKELSKEQFWLMWNFENAVPIRKIGLKAGDKILMVERSKFYSGLLNCAKWESKIYEVLELKKGKILAKASFEREKEFKANQMDVLILLKD